MDSTTNPHTNPATCLSEILPSLLSYHHELLLDNMRGRRALGHEGNLKVTDDIVNDFILCAILYASPGQEKMA